MDALYKGKVQRRNKNERGEKAPKSMDGMKDVQSYQLHLENK